MTKEEDEFFNPLAATKHMLNALKNDARSAAFRAVRGDPNETYHLMRLRRRASLLNNDRKLLLLRKDTFAVKEQAFREEM